MPAITLSDEQQQILKSQASSIMIQAQPGSGKTRLLVERFLADLKRRHLQPDQIVAITFTQKAADEMRERIAEALPHHQRGRLIDQLWISTIHGFCHRLLSQHVWEAGLATNFTVLTAEEALYLREVSIHGMFQDLKAAQDPSLFYLIKHYGHARLKLMIEKLFYQHLRMPNLKPEEVLRKCLFLYETARKRFLEEKKKRNTCDFDDLLVLTHRLLKQHPAVRWKYRSQFKSILVDEFQDTDWIQKDIVDCLTAVERDDRDHALPCPSLMVVGDPKQSIYRFRGAESDIFDRTRCDILERQGFCFEMVRNFRSQPKLIEFVNSFFEPVQISNFLKSKPGVETPFQQSASVEYWKRRAEDGQAKLSSAEGRVREAQWLAEHVQSFKKQSGKQRWSHIALLFRAMTYTGIYEEALNAAGVPWVRSDGGYFYQSAEVEALLSFLKWTLNPEDDFALWVGISSKWGGIAAEDLGKIALLRSQKKRSLYDVIIASAQFPKLAGRLQRLLALRERTSLVEWYGELPLEWTDAETRFIEQVRQFERHGSDRSWSDFLRYMEALKGSSIRASDAVAEPAQDGVRILSIHQSKGLEFDVVFAPDLSYQPRVDYGYLLIDKKLGIGLKIPDEKPNSWIEDEVFQDIKAKEKGEDVEESKRLLYVALTRAKGTLVLSHGSFKPRKNSWAAWVEMHKSKISHVMKEQMF